jgi:exopolysaccharide biosynthesis polyprenyl glycosylphosphotransferase
MSLFRRYSTNFAILSILADAGLISLALFLANSVRPWLGGLPFAQDLQDPIIPTALYPLFILAWIGINLLQGLYDGRRNLYLHDELSNLTVASILAAVSTAGLLYFSFRDISRLLFLVFCLLAFVLMSLWRVLVRMALINSAGSAQKRTLMIIGAGRVGRELASEIQKSDLLGIDLAGFLDDEKRVAAGKVPILGTVRQAAALAESLAVDDVVIALPQRAHKTTNDVLAALHALPIQVWVIPDYLHFALHKASADHFAGIPMLNLRAPALTESQRLTKRLFDLSLTLLILPAALLVMTPLALLIWFQDRGPVLFRQPRVGENGSLFSMYKFRSMVPGAEDKLEALMAVQLEGHRAGLHRPEPVHKSESDPRITRIGRLIRRTSLDELPQLFNVLRGDMSLVGPRPEQPFLVAQYEPWQRKRFAVPQGMTGWWQINGRSDKPMHLHTEDDLYYIQNYSIFLDLRIVIRTILVVLRGRGAF